jgi:hypothetical protein
LPPRSRVARPSGPHFCIGVDINEHQQLFARLQRARWASWASSSRLSFSAD